MSQQNPFGDVDRELGRRGVLDGEGWTTQEKIEEKLNVQGLGYDFICHCQNCSQKVCVMLPWIELVPASMGLTPVDGDSGTPWVYRNGYLYPPIVCGCQSPIHVPITPEKAARCIETGIKARAVSPQAIQQTQLRVQQMAGAGRR